MDDVPPRAGPALPPEGAPPLAALVPPAPVDVPPAEGAVPDCPPESAPAAPPDTVDEWPPRLPPVACDPTGYSCPLQLMQRATSPKVSHPSELFVFMVFSRDPRESGMPCNMLVAGIE